MIHYKPIKKIVYVPSIIHNTNNPIYPYKYDMKEYKYIILCKKIKLNYFLEEGKIQQKYANSAKSAHFAWKYMMFNAGFSISSSLILPSNHLLIVPRYGFSLIMLFGHLSTN